MKKKYSNKYSYGKYLRELKGLRKKDSSAKVIIFLKTYLKANEIINLSFRIFIRIIIIRSYY